MKKKLIIMLMVTALCVLTACGKTKKESEYNDVSLDEIVTSVKTAYGDSYYPVMELDETMLQETVGLSPELYDQAVAEVPMISASVDTFIAVDAKEGKEQEVKDVLLAYQKRLQEDTRQYPLNQLRIQASKVVDYGDKVFFIMLGEITREQEEQDDDNAIIKAHEAQNQIGIDTIESVLIKK